MNGYIKVLAIFRTFGYIGLEEHYGIGYLASAELNLELGYI